MINFTITELQREVADLPPYGFFSVDKDSGHPALFYDFVCDKDFQIDSERFECFDAHVGSGSQHTTRSYARKHKLAQCTG